MIIKMTEKRKKTSITIVILSITLALTILFSTVLYVSMNNQINSANQNANDINANLQSWISDAQGYATSNENLTASIQNLESQITSNQDNFNQLLTIFANYTNSTQITLDNTWTITNIYSSSNTLSSGNTIQNTLMILEYTNGTAYAVRIFFVQQQILSPAILVTNPN